jgi:2-phosphoglycerate kinase
LATIVDNGKEIPFLRGMLTHYLIGRGFSFKEAYEVADEVRGALHKRKTISAQRMVSLVRKQAKELAADHDIGDGLFWIPRSRQVLVEDSGEKRPFSREHLAHSLNISGVNEDQAYRIAEQIGAEFIQQGSTVVRRQTIFKAALRLLSKESGEVYAERYWIWNWFRNDTGSIPIIVLIGGASGVGKTSVAVGLANLLRVSRVASTDEIRQVMRLMIAPDLMPALHHSSFRAWEYATPLPSKEGDPVILGFREQSARVCVGVRATIERAIEENLNLIVDGVHLLPDLVQTDEHASRALFIRANLFLPDKRPFVERFKLRSTTSSRKRHRYVRYLDKILKIQDHILQEGEAHGVPAIENTDLEESVQTIALHIMDTLRTEAAPRSVRRRLAAAVATNGKNGKNGKRVKKA